MAGPGRRLAVCRKPGCSKMLTGKMFAERVRRARLSRAESHPDAPKLERCLLIAWAYMRGRMRRGNADATL